MASDVECEDALSCLFFFFAWNEASMEKREHRETRALGPVFQRERQARHGKES